MLKPRKACKSSLIWLYAVGENLPCRFLFPNVSGSAGCCRQAALVAQTDRADGETVVGEGLMQIEGALKMCLMPL